ncbi:hypothetical protein WA026_003889 [Henosepilachna vigintioctopunctata]|uniref:TFIIS N-terminal domain-containing protein n=1 Tax=Henosepilachna vigintioctopunctata TaxID=420089 RepID=A0AAW1UDM2_9CUCU
MTESGENLLLAISRYQRDLEKYLKRQDAAKMLHTLRNLDKLPIEMYHLEETLIGRTVNSLPLFGGEVGEEAKCLVEKWQEMVLKELDEEDVHHEDIKEGNIVHHEFMKNNSSENTDHMKINEIEKEERKSDVNIEQNHESKRSSRSRSTCSSENGEIDTVKISNSDECLLKSICHYQKGLERNFRKKNELKMLHKLRRLDKLSIEVSHLEETLIGRTVNNLRIFGGEVGEAANSLVQKWQEMVIQAIDKEFDESFKSASPGRNDYQEKKREEENKKRFHSSSDGNTVDHVIKNYVSDSTDNMNTNGIKQKTRNHFQILKIVMKVVKNLRMNVSILVKMMNVRKTETAKNTNPQIEEKS